jgi:hypothetical protein
MIPLAQWLFARIERDDSSRQGVNGDLAGEIDLIEDLEASLTNSLGLENELRFRKKLAQERKVWIELFSAEMSGRLKVQISALESKLKSQVSEAISPLLEDHIRRKGVDDFCSIVQKYLGAGSAIDLAIKSPSYLVPVISKRMKEKQIAGNVEETESPELSVIIGTTEIQTELQAWITDLRLLVDQ